MWRGRLTKVVKFIGWGLLALFGAVIGLTAIGRATDPPLSPQVRAALQWPPPGRATEGNAYHWALGLMAKDGADFSVVGEQLAGQISDVFAANRHLSDAQRRKLYDQVKIPNELPELAINSLGPTDADTLVADLSSRRQTITAALERHATVFARYEQIRDHPNFVARDVPDSDLMSYSQIVKPAKLDAARCALLALDGLWDGSLACFSRIDRFAKRMVADSASLIGAMIGLSIWRESVLRPVEQLLRNPSLGKSALRVDQSESWVAMLLERPTGWGDLSAALAAQYRTQANLLREMKQGASWAHFMEHPGLSEFVAALPDALTQPNATTNSQFEAFDAMAQAAKLAPAAWAANQVALRSQVERFAHPHPVWHPKSWLNIGGVLVSGVLNQIVAAGYSGYKEKLHDIDGFARLIAARTAMRQTGSTSAGCAAWMAQSAPQYRSPWDDSPMRCVAVAENKTDVATLVFVGRSVDGGFTKARTKEWSIPLMP